MKNKRLYHQIAILLAIIAIILVIVIIIWGERGMSFIPIIPLSIALIIEKKIKESK